jgi:hypothetical protein
MTKPAIKDHSKPKDKGFDSASAREASRRNDDAVRDTVTVDNGQKSVLPGPPIPPETAREIARKRQRT